MCKITPNELLTYANKFLKENYGMTLNVPLVINGRLKTTYGRFRYKINRVTGEKKETSVELNKTFIVANSKEDVFNVLRHELIHYALFMLKKPFQDGQRYFENELRKHNTYSQMDMSTVSLKSCYKSFYTYVCDCGQGTTTKNITNGSYSCSKCKKNIVAIKIEKKLV